MNNVGVNRNSYANNNQNVASPATRREVTSTPEIPKTSTPQASTASNYSGRGAVPSHPSPAKALKFSTPSTTVDPDKILASLPKNQESPAYYSAINKILKNPAQRAALIQKFGLNSPENVTALKVATFMEGGGANAKLTAEIIMNRAITVGIVDGKTSISALMRDPGQFEINNPKVMHSKTDPKTKERLKTFDEVMASRTGVQWTNAQSNSINDVVSSIVSGQRASSGTLYYGFHGNGVRNVPDTTRIDRGTVRRWT
ncbi:MAG: hypothetical protein U0457_08830 [Candidatus Sericytochromatia bacterium]